MKLVKSSRPGPKSKKTAGIGSAGRKAPFGQGFDQSKEVRAIARERVGAVKPSSVIEDKKQRKKPKHKRPAGTLPDADA